MRHLGILSITYFKGFGYCDFCIDPLKIPGIPKDLCKNTNDTCLVRECMHRITEFRLNAKVNVLK